MYDDYNLVISSSGKNYFLGLKIDETTHKIDKGYACGIKSENPNQGTPFCIEGLNTSLAANKEILNNTTTGIWQGNCENSEYGGISCSGNIRADDNGAGAVYVGTATIFNVVNYIDQHACVALYDEGSTIECLN